MSIPKSVIKFKRGGVEYVSSVDRVQYTIVELTRAAMKDVGKYVVRMCNKEAMRLHGLRKSRRVKGKTSTFLYDVPWAKTGLPLVDIEVKHHTWYGVAQELGGAVQGAGGGLRIIPKLGILRNTTYNNIPEIVKIESQYLSALEDEAAALRLIDEKEEHQEGGGDN